MTSLANLLGVVLVMVGLAAVPSVADAQIADSSSAALAQSEGAPAPPPVVSPPGDSSLEMQKRWGAYARMIGHQWFLGSYEMATGTVPVSTTMADMVTEMKWVVPGKEMMMSAKDAAGNVVSTTITKWDPVTGDLVTQMPSGLPPAHATVQADGSLVQLSNSPSAQYRSTSRLLVDGSVEIHMETMERGAWVFLARMVSYERSPEGIALWHATEAQWKAKADEDRRRASTLLPAATPAFEETIFEQLAALNGERLVSSDGFLDIYMEGDALALHFGALGAPRTGQRWLLKRIPGQSDLVILEHPNFDANGPYFAEIRDKDILSVGSIAREGPHGSKYTFDPVAGVIATRFASDPDTHEVVDVIDRFYARATAQAIVEARSEHKEEVAAAEEVKRLREEREDASRRAVYDMLVQANAEADVHLAQTQASYEATLAQARQQAEQQRAQASIEGAADAEERRNQIENARQATQRQYEIARQFESRNQGGSRASSAEIPVDGEDETASTSTDANQCVSQPEMQLNATTTGNTAARIANGCGEPVDVRICLMTAEKGWNCGATWGLAPQASWSWSSYNATGEVFMDTRVTGSKRALAEP